jgi:hypothetical protein
VATPIPRLADGVAGNGYEASFTSTCLSGLSTGLETGADGGTASAAPAFLPPGDGPSACGMEGGGERGKKGRAWEEEGNEDGSHGWRRCRPRTFSFQSYSPVMTALASPYLHPISTGPSTGTSSSPSFSDFVLRGSR